MRQCVISGIVLFLCLGAAARGPATGLCLVKSTGGDGNGWNEVASFDTNHPSDTRPYITVGAVGSGPGVGGGLAYQKGNRTSGQLNLFHHHVGPVLTALSNGNVGVGTSSPTQKLSVNGNIHATGAVTQGSSRDLKQDIEALNLQEALAALTALQPTKYRYKSDQSESHVGFVAEDVPELVATNDRNSLSPMDIVAVLTKVVQEQQAMLEAQQAEIEMLKAKIGQ